MYRVYEYEIQHGAAVVAPSHQGRSDGGIWGIYTLPKSGQVNFLWGNNVARTVTEHFVPPKKLLYPQKQISGYAPASHVSIILIAAVYNLITLSK